MAAAPSATAMGTPKMMKTKREMNRTAVMCFSLRGGHGRLDFFPCDHHPEIDDGVNEDVQDHKKTAQGNGKVDKAYGQPCRGVAHLAHGPDPVGDSGALREEETDENEADDITQEQDGGAAADAFHEFRERHDPNVLVVIKAHTGAQKGGPNKEIAADFLGPGQWGVEHIPEYDLQEDHDHHQGEHDHKQLAGNRVHNPVKRFE
jgi:hypothetical protein